VAADESMNLIRKQSNWYSS